MMEYQEWSLLNLRSFGLGAGMRGVVLIVWLDDRVRGGPGSIPREEYFFSWAVSLFYDFF